MSGKSNRRFEAGGGAGVDALRFRQTREHSTSACAGRQVYNAQGKVVGCITSDGWLEKRVDPSVHMLRRPPAWATDADHLDLPIRGVRLRCPDGTVYEAGVELFQRHGFAFDRGHGRQVALPLQFWRVTRAGEPVQLSLLEVST